MEISGSHLIPLAKRTASKIKAMKRYVYPALGSLISMLLILQLDSCHKKDPDAPPVISSFTPSSGPVGTIVLITGNNFGTSGTSISVNGKPGIVNTTSPTQLTITVPATATTGKI